MAAVRVFALILATGSAFLSYAAEKFQFNIDRQRADLALTEFAKQANTTLIFPFDVAKQETANALTGEYSLELGIIKLLEGTGLYPVEDASGRFIVRPVRDDKSAKQQNSPSPEAVSNVVTQPHNEFEKIAVVGTRASPRSAIESAVPLDIIDSQTFARQGATDLLSMLATLIPSYNVNDQPINDASSLVRPANLRGLSSDHTLVLFNGKRRHRSAVITFLGGGLSDGAQGPDISAIPVSALKQVEVLRDGAAAQYGSDAIAGVINFVLKDDDEGGTVQTRMGSFYAGDGGLVQLQGNRGFSVGGNGFLNASIEYRQQHSTSRSVQRDDAAALQAAGNHYVAAPAQHWGMPAVKYDVKMSGNFGLEFEPEQQVYAFSNLAKKKIEGAFYFRNPHTRSGLNDGGTDAQGTPLLLVADLDGLGQGLACPAVTINDGNVLDDPDYRLIADNSTAVGRNCFAFNEWFPGGFAPRFGGTLIDASLFVGTRGTTSGGWWFDVSASVGFSEVEYALSDTVNPSLGPMSPTVFSPGRASQSEKNINADFSREFSGDLLGIVNLAGGVEWRREKFKQRAGDLASYQVGPLAFNPDNGTSQGFGVGSNGFPGYKPEVAGDWGRGNWALYADVESQLSDDWLAGLAVRYEDFSDFGTTFDGKLSLRAQLMPELAARASVSTGFKAPTVGQSNVINVTTAFGTNGLEDQATLPPTDPIAAQLGASALTPEESTNVSIGLVGQPLPDVFFTLDYFNIRLTDRISTTSAIPLTQQDIAALLAQGVRDASSFSAAKYFTNDFDTRTQGIDLVVNYSRRWLGGNSEFSLAYNWTDTEVNRISSYARTDAEGRVFLETNLTPQRIRMIEDNLPAYRATFSAQHDIDRWSLLYRLNVYGGIYEDHLDASSELDIKTGAEITHDVEINYSITASTQVAFGARNLFDNYPDDNPWSGIAGAQYPPTAPMGFNGGFYYLRALYSF